MKKIAEMFIGSGMINDKGTPTAFISYDQENHEYKGICGYCSEVAYFGKHYYAEYSCPICGAKHEEYKVFSNSDPKQPMPYKMRFSLIDFKDKVELRIVYHGIKLDSKYRYYGEVVKNVREKYVFTFDGQSPYWQYDNETVHVRKELGYLSSFHEMEEKTALWYITADHFVRKGSQTAFLKTLRKVLSKHMKERGFQEKTLFLPTNKPLKLFASVLTIAHKIRFWDAELIPYGGKGKLSFHKWMKDIVKNQCLPEHWEEERNKRIKSGMSYNEALMAALNLPNTPFVRKHLTYANLYPLCKAFSLPTKDMACIAFPVFKEKAKVREREYGLITDDCRAIENICEFINTFYPFYPKLKVSQIIRDWSDWYEDILRSWNMTDKKTREDYERENVPFSKLHDWLSVAITKQQDRDIVFEIDDGIMNLLRQSVGRYQFRCVERKSQLKQIAMTLKNCALSHAGRIGKVEQLVVVTDDDGNIIALLEIRSGKIVQAKLFANKDVSNSEEVNKACVEYSKLTKISCATRDIEMIA